MVEEKNQVKIIKLLLSINVLLFIVSIGLVYITAYQPHLFLNSNLGKPLVLPVRLEKV